MCSPLYRAHCYCVSECRLYAHVFPTVQNTLLRCGSVILYIMGVGRKGGQRPLILKFSSCVGNLEVLKNTNIDRFIDTSALRFLFGSKE
jgi:hypothetical protein